MQHRKKRLIWFVGALFGYALLVLAFSLARGALASQGVGQIGPAQFGKPTYSSPIALSANNALLWVVNPDDDSVSVIRTDTNAVLDKITVGDEPQSIAVDPNNTFAYVANAADNSVTVIRIFNATPGPAFDAREDTTFVTGSEPWNIVISPDGNRVIVANSGQDTLTIINANTRQIIGNYNLATSVCNDHNNDNIGDPAYHFQPRGLAITQNNTRLYVTRFLSFTKVGGRQATNDGKEGVVCKLNLNTAGTTVPTVLSSPAKIVLAARPSGFPPNVNEPAYPNQMQSIVIRGNYAYLPNIASAPDAPFAFNADTQAFVNKINGIGGTETDGGATNLHLGARQPEAGKTKLFFANPWAIAFTTQSGAGFGYVVSAGSDLLVKVSVNPTTGALDFAGACPTCDADTARYIDLNDPDEPATSDLDAGKNPLGIVITDDGDTAYVMNYVSRSVSVVDLTSDSVVDVIRTTELPPPGTLDEILQVGKEIFFSSRGHFDSEPDTTVATSDRLSSEGWQNCASCHFAGLTDGNIWQFNTGPRKSVPLNATWNPHNPDDQRILNYSAIFDEVQDFEGNIRNTSGPNLGFTDPNHGLLISDTLNLNDPPVQFATLGRPNAGRPQFTVTLPEQNASETRNPIPALDAMKEWVRFAVRTPNGPLSTAELSAGGGNTAGGLNQADIDQGRALFFRAGCQTCHGGGKWTNSTKDFESPPVATDVVRESGAGVNVVPFLDRFLQDIDSFDLNVPGSGNAIPGTPLIGGTEEDAAGNKPLGKDHNGDGKGDGFNIPSVLGIWHVPPYYHNGACETLACVLADQDHRTANGTRPDVLSNATDRDKVVTFLKSIDADTQPAANLYVDDHDIFFEPPAVIAGTTVNVGVNVSLFGSAVPTFTPGPLKVTFYDGRPGQPGTQVIGTADLAGINTAFGQATVTVPWNVPNQVGRRFVFVTVDATNLFVEDNERDNTAGRRIRVRPVPPDRTPPTVSSVLINDGDTVTDDNNVSITFTATDPTSPAPQQTSGLGSYCIVRYSYDTARRRWVEQECQFAALPAPNNDGSFTVQKQLESKEGTAYAFIWVKDKAGNISVNPGFDVISFIPSGPIELERNDARLFRITLDPGASFTFTATPETGDVDLAVFDGTTRIAVSARNGQEQESVTFSNSTSSAKVFQVEVHPIDTSRITITTSETLASLLKPSADVIAPTKEAPTQPLAVGPPRKAAIQNEEDSYMPMIRK